MKLFEVFGNQDGEFSRQFISAIVRGELDIQDALNQDTADGRALNRMVDVVASETGLYPDDDFDELSDIIHDRFVQQYGR